MASQKHILSNSLSSSGSEADPSDPQNITDIRKRKRMESNRESARRSRERKQKHLDDLTAQVSELKAQNTKILTTIDATTQLYIDMEAENSVLRAQIAELSYRLQSLNDIVSCINKKKSHDNSEFDDQESFGSFDLEFDDGFSLNSWGNSFGTFSHQIGTIGC